MVSIKKLTLLMLFLSISPCIAKHSNLHSLHNDNQEVATNDCQVDSSMTTKGLSLNNIICIAIKRYPTIASARSGYEGYMEMIEAAKAGYYPQINFNVQTTKSSGIRDGYANTPKVTMQQRIYDFGKVSSSIEQSKAEADRQRGNVLQQIDNIIIQSGNLALEIQRLETLELKSKNLLQGINKVLDIAISRSNSGVSTQSDYIQAKSRQEAAEANLFDIQTQLSTTRRKLTTYIGSQYSNAKLATIGDKLFNRNILQYPINEKQIPTVIMNQAFRSMAQAQVDSAKAASMPTISLVGSVEKTIHGYNPNNGKYKGNYNYLGLSVEQSVFSGGENLAKLKSAQKQLNLADYDIKTIRLELNDQVDSIKLNINGIESRIKVLASRLKSINETRILYREQYTLGSRPILDLLNSEEEVFQAETNLINAHHDRWSYYLQYLVVTGNARQIFKLEPLVDKYLGQSNGK